MEQYKIFGPPGTGKTTFLLELLEKEFSKVHPTDCAFVSFTRKGTYEGVQRAVQKFSLDKKELSYFKTIHALCYAEMGARRHDILQPKHFQQFSDAMGLKFFGSYSEDLANSNDQFIFAEQLARNNPKAFENLLTDLDIKKFQWVAANYRKFKKQLELIDFTDLLEIYANTGSPLPVKVAFIDEAQDLTTLQWAVVKKMFAECERVYIAGDDDQAIYEWSGADVQAFLRHPGKITVLSKSYRLPAAVHRRAVTVAEQIATRQDKSFTSNERQGEVSHVANIRQADLTQATLILSRNNFYLDKIEDDLKDLSLVYTRRESCSVDQKKLAAIKKYTEWQAGKWSDQDMRLYAQYFRELDKEKNWVETLNDSDKNVNYYQKIIASQVDTSSAPHIELSTIHASKGGERDHVVLLLDISNRVARNLERNRDAELRCLYVAITRARQKLTIVYNQAPNAFPWCHQSPQIAA